MAQKDSEELVSTSGDNSDIAPEELAWIHESQRMDTLRACVLRGEMHICEGPHLRISSSQTSVIKHRVKEFF
ncbi:hypothetical protein KJ562_02450 [Patescibacteria group bacterium]|nr:hypothetical protein [Patescibacteria group bacterium]MBU4162329.1 hypothetical protein [Patescibacteria group bacterium]